MQTKLECPMCRAVQETLGLPENPPHDDGVRKRAIQTFISSIIFFGATVVVVKLCIVPTSN